MTETKRQKWTRLVDTRSPKVLRGLELLAVLKTGRYDPDPSTARTLLAALESRLSDVRAAWGCEAPEEPRRAPEPAPRPVAIPQGTAEGGASFENEVRWALDAVKRGDLELAEDRLKRILRPIDD